MGAKDAMETMMGSPLKMEGARRAGMTPFIRSRAKVMMAGPFPRSLATLVAPMLLEPASMMSISPKKPERMTPVGIPPRQ